ncbi:MAG: polyprenyl synthetase family protein [Erythrobacter sp.]|nr:polyprenyl synthetase family protein [Erythrobacter sp.]NCQ63376.1 polyprenyl synthetase family protein [Alphaproteobacteria bacterium]
MEFGDTDDARLSMALATIGTDIDQAFDRLLPVPDDTRAPLFEAMRYAAIGGGKRVRPLLLVSTATMLGVSRQAAVLAGAAVESIHVYSLIHDDLPCMDDDDMRRGKPTVHKAYDEATAVLAGDALHALAFEILTFEEVSTVPSVQAELTRCLALASGMGGMAGGQAMDMAAESATYDLHTITRLQQLKTGALLTASVEMGAILARLPHEGRAPLINYARDIGLAFQIVDDLLDHEGDEKKAGKALRKDDEQGKQTFVSLMGADAARQQAQALIDQACGHLAHYGEDAGVLCDLARYIVERDR